MMTLNVSDDRLVQPASLFKRLIELHLFDLLILIFCPKLVLSISLYDTDCKVETGDYCRRDKVLIGREVFSGQAPISDRFKHSETGISGYMTLLSNPHSLNFDISLKG